MHGFMELPFWVDRIIADSSFNVFLSGRQLPGYRMHDKSFEAKALAIRFARGRSCADSFYDSTGQWFMVSTVSDGVPEMVERAAALKPRVNAQVNIDAGTE
ncbi:hypothetical protein J8273_8801 [Carpediemonas membranifera]|uniref:Uncharacterized protein n=1 Tax=Carpediemonas membranifera TaxID=201153 RepID=A0A8J6AVU7_9EUKA|nr:hypothetical protein J8273_8801 [Carpediemonas membranifera]|eukprot:KAG9389508.1 hypothetical protein J8273_8801 [Carpediemonas membranifera]